MIEELLKEYEKKMNNAIEVMKNEFATLRTGRASLAILDTIRVEYYGSMLPLNQVATLNVPDPRTITIQPWDKSLLSVIEKEIQKANLGVNPVNDGNAVKIIFPPLTEERRKELVKVAGKFAEAARVAIRNIRREANDKVKSMEKNKEISEDELRNYLDRIQKLTDKYISIVDDLFHKKEQDILTI